MCPITVDLRGNDLALAAAVPVVQLLDACCPLSWKSLYVTFYDKNTHVALLLFQQTDENHRAESRMSGHDENRRMESRISGHNSRAIHQVLL